MPAASPCTLQPINLHDAEEFEALRRQRIACGWYSEPERLQKWKIASDAGTKSLFWILLLRSSPDQSLVPDDLPPTATGATNDEKISLRAGHISLDSITEHPDPAHLLAHPDKSLLTICTFFISPEFQNRGLGRAAMTQIETLARREPYGNQKCTAIAITSLSKRYVEDEAWRAKYQMWTGCKPQSFEDWYARMGYCKFKEEAYIKETALDGSEFVLVEAFMKKSLPHSSVPHPSDGQGAYEVAMTS